MKSPEEIAEELDCSLSYVYREYRSRDIKHQKGRIQMEHERLDNLISYDDYVNTTKAELAAKHGVNSYRLRKFAEWKGWRKENKGH